MVTKISDLICTGYDEYWVSKAFVRAIKGAKGSGKSKTVAIWHILFMMKYAKANTLVVRKVYGTLKDSCYTDLLWAIDLLGVTKWWSASLNPLELTYKRNPNRPQTWQRILFRGLDDPQKIASIGVRNGYLCWVWFEEASQINNYLDYKKVEMSIRGFIPKETGLWKSITLTFNPWSEKHWLKEQFFDVTDDPSIFTTTTTYRNNKWLDETDLERYHALERNNPILAAVICNGDWGVAEGQVYTDWEEQVFDIKEVIATHPNIKLTYGLDFGYSISYNAFAAVAIDEDSRTIWFFDEMYERGMTNFQIAKRITEMGYQREVIIADCAEPKSIYELRQGFRELITDEEGNAILDENEQPQYNYYVLPNIRSAMKGSDSLANGIRRMQSYHIIVHSYKCLNAITELSNYCFAQDKDGNFLDKPISDYDHYLDSARYSLEAVFVKGNGLVKEAGGDSPIEVVPATKHKCRRVFSTCD